MWNIQLQVKIKIKFIGYFLGIIMMDERKYTYNWRTKLQKYNFADALIDVSPVK